MSELPINQIICGDCLEVMKDWPDNCVDLVLADPPYGIGFTYEKSEYKDCKHTYIEMLWPRIEAAERCAKDAIAVFQAAKMAHKYSEWFPRNWRLLCIGKLFGQWMPTHIQWRTDYVLYWLLNRKPSETWDTDYVARDYFVSDRCCVTSGPNARPDHPCPRPIDTMLYLVDVLAQPSSIILDPFCGSGTTCVAAKKLGRRYIGIDISEEYCQIARDRLESIETGVPVNEKRKGQQPLFP